jgi:purine/pyrimidine-nucleoside phosphorylase
MSETSTQTTLDNVSVATQANVYFGGKCVSYTVTDANGVRKSVGVILPSSLRFTTGAPEVMELTAGSCRVKLPGSDWQAFSGGQSFNAPGDAAFEIEVTETLHYVCHFG